MSKREDIIAGRLSDILPDRAETLEADEARKEAVSQRAGEIVAGQNAAEIARLKFNAKRRLKRMEDRARKADEERAALAESLGLSSPEELPQDASTAHQAEELYRQREKVKAIETIEAENAEPLRPSDLISRRGRVYSSNIAKALPLEGATRPEVAKLLTSLNINLNVQLSKTDTANLLACLLTCNEDQLRALNSNRRIPVAIKMVIKRLLEDMRLGNVDTLERLWDRVFGKGSMQAPSNEPQGTDTGLLPNVPISREAYVIIRDKMLK